MLIQRSQIIPDVLLFKPTIYLDNRGRFLETYRAKDIMEEAGHSINFVQGNLSYSNPGVLRGIHFQTKNPQGKLMRCIHGRIQQVSVDLRDGSPFFGKHVSTILDDKDGLSVWVPPGFGNGFLVPRGSFGATVHYECSTYYVDEWNGAVHWNDPDLGIHWMLQGHNPVLSQKDRAAPFLRNVEAIKLEGGGA